MQTLSASKIKTYQSCNRQFFYRYIDKIPSGVSGRALLGRAIHKAIELGFQGQGPFTVFNEYWLAGMKQVTGNENLQKIYNEGLKMLDLYNFNQAPPLESELGFTLPYPNAEEPIVMMNGYFDQVYANSVIDMKTSLRRPKESVLKYSPQFIIYAWAFQQLYGKIPKIYWHHLRTGEKFLADITQDQIDSFVPNVRTFAAHLRYTEEMEHYHRNVGTECDLCSYRGVCLGEGEEKIQ